MRMGRDVVVVTSLRIGKSLRNHLAEAARAEGKSLNAEIIRRLEESLRTRATLPSHLNVAPTVLACDLRSTVRDGLLKVVEPAIERELNRILGDIDSLAERITACNSPETRAKAPIHERSRSSDIRTISVPEAGKRYLGVSRNLAYKAASTGAIPTIRVGRLLRVSVAAMEAQFSSANYAEAEEGK